MFGIVRKDLRHYAPASLVLMPALAAAERLATGGLQPLYLAVNCVVVLVLAIGCVLLSEQEEEKSHGYALLGMLPVSVREIVPAKYLLALAATAVNVGWNLALIASWEGAAGRIAASQGALVLAGTTSLLLAGVMYLGIFWLGYTRFLTVFFAAFVALQIPFALRARGGALSPPAIERFLRNLDCLGLVLAGLLIYAGLMWLAAGLFSFEERKKPIPWF